MRLTRLAVTTALLAVVAGGTSAYAVAVGRDAQQLDPRTIALREKFFGTENVDHRTGAVRKDRVILTWASVMTYAAAINGNVVLLDGWVARGLHSGYVPTDAGELALLKPSHVFVGHGHFDHAADVARIVSESDAVLVGTPEHCDQVRLQAAGEFFNRDVACVAAVPRGAAPGTSSAVTALPGVAISTVTVVHSGAQAPDPSDPGGLHQPIVPPNDFSVIADHPPAPADVAHVAAHQMDEEGGSVVYQFRVKDFALTFHDTSGPNKELAPEVYPALRALPKTDVQVASVQGFGQITNGGRDFRLMVEALRPSELVPGHHDNWMPGISTRGSYYRPYVVEELARIPVTDRPVLRWVQDPEDYLRPMSWTVDDPRWRR